MNSLAALYLLLWGYDTVQIGTKQNGFTNQKKEFFIVIVIINYRGIRSSNA